MKLQGLNGRTFEKVKQSADSSINDDTNKGRVERINFIRQTTRGTVIMWGQG